MFYFTGLHEKSLFGLEKADTSLCWLIQLIDSYTSQSRAMDSLVSKENNFSFIQTVLQKFNNELPSTNDNLSNIIKDDIE